MQTDTMIPQPELISQGNPNQKIALEGVQIRSHILGFSQEVTVEQRFRNKEDSAIEAVYTYPLPDKAAVCSLEIRKADRIITGEIEEMEKAQELYQEAVEDGHSAYLTEAHRPDIFSTHVGNLGPGETVTIRIQYIMTLKPVDDKIRLSFPTTIAPRYMPQGSLDTETALDGDAVNPPHAHHVPYGLNLEVVLDEGFPLIDADSSSHQIQASKDDDGTTTLTIAGEKTDMDRDVVINLKLERQEEPHALSAKGPDGKQYVTLTFFPEVNDTGTEHVATETVFVIDASGSMDGSSYEQARQALELCLRSLGTGDTFNIIRFGSTFQTWKPAPQVYSANTLHEALQYINYSHADLGGTEIFSPLQDLFAQPVRTGQTRDVILLTDGQVSNEDAVQELAKRHADQNRIFTFGIGSASSAYLVNGLAEATRGASEYIHNGEPIEEKVLRTFSRLGSPRIKDLQLTFPGNKDRNVKLATAEMPPIFDGDAFTVHARVKGKDDPREAILSGEGPSGEKLEWAARVQAAPEVSGSVPHLSWARERIRELESGLTTNRYQKSFIDERKAKTRRRRIIGLSQRHGILCSLTNFIAVEHRSEAERLRGEPALRRIPVQIARDWHGIHSQAVHKSKRGIFSFKAKPSRAAASPQNYRFDDICDFMSGPQDINPREIESNLRHKIVQEDLCPQSPTAFHNELKSLKALDSPSRPSSNNKVMKLLGGMSADGNIQFDDWTNNGDLLEEIRRALVTMEGEPPREYLDSIIETLAALIRLEKDFPGEKALWERAARKAVLFLFKHLGRENLEILGQSLGLRSLRHS